MSQSITHINTNNYTLITGAAVRVGKAIAIFLAEKGCNIVIHYNRSNQAATELQQYLMNTYKIKCHLIQGDLNCTSQTQAMFANLYQQDIFITTLINSASSFYFDDLFNFNDSQWQENFNTNLKAPLLLSNQFAQYFNLPNKLRNNNHNNLPGNIINIVDTWCLHAPTRFLSYNLAKLALWKLTEIMAVALAPTIRVNGVAPGLTLKSDTMEEARFAGMYQNTPMQAPVLPINIAKTIWFILNNPAICGEIIKVDGGKSLIE